LAKDRTKCPEFVKRNVERMAILVWEEVVNVLLLYRRRQIFNRKNRMVRSCFSVCRSLVIPGLFFEELANFFGTVTSLALNRCSPASKNWSRYNVRMWTEEEGHVNGEKKLQA